MKVAVASRETKLRDLFLAHSRLARGLRSFPAFSRSLNASAHPIAASPLCARHATPVALISRRPVKLTPTLA